ncbi:beta-glucosidase-like glycosyl hydrolase [Massilia sp. MP_M2]
MQLAGGANLIREPRGGRNVEYLSEDPLLTGIMAGHSVAGIQAQGVVSTVKHFVANGQETGRVMVSANLAEAALRESDLLAFQIAIEIRKPGAVMPGYNLINGHYASENAFLLQQLLEDEWGYPGWVMSDWGATHSTVKGVLAGLDVQSGANLDDAHYFGQALRDAVRDGQVPHSRIDDMVPRILTSLIDVGALGAQPTEDRMQPIDFSHHKLIAQRQAEERIVLLTNRDATLPLPQRLARLLIVGELADHGVLCGGGSSAVTPIGSLQLSGTSIMGMDVAKVVQPSSLVTAIEEESGAREVVFVDGTDRKQVLDAARKADAVIVFAQEWRSEGLDAVAGVLLGRVNPSGRLPVTFPASEAQLPRPGQIDPETTASNPATPRKGGIIPLDYDIEGSDVGYRWFAREGHEPLFPFGFGLSYTTLELTGLQLSVNGRYTASVEVTNAGTRTGRSWCGSMLPNLASTASSSAWPASPKRRWPPQNGAASRSTSNRASLRAAWWTALGRVSSSNPASTVYGRRSMPVTTHSGRMSQSTRSAASRPSLRPARRAGAAPQPENRRR